jgi:hypothetical protein
VSVPKAPEPEATFELQGHKHNDKLVASGKLWVGREHQEQARSSFKETLELFGKIILGLAGFCYVIGVLVVSVHLRQYGVNSLALSQLSYVMAGMWAFIPIVLWLAMLALVNYGIAIDSLTKNEKPRASKTFLGGASNIFGSKTVNVLASIAVALIMMGLAAEYLSKYLGLHLGLINWILIPWLGIVAAFTTSTALFNLAQRDTYKTFGDLTIGLGLAIFALLLSMWYVMAFANRTYNDIPMAIGGGGPTRVEMIVTPEGKAYLENIGIVFASQNRTASLQLLLAAEKQYVIIGADGQAVSVPADAVKLMIYEK